MEQKNLAKTIDHTILKPEATANDVEKLCKEAAQFGFASVCVNPCHVPQAVRLLENSGVMVCTVVGFPLGATTTASKCYEATEAVQTGALEIDMVLNIGAVKAGNMDFAEADVKAVVQAVTHANPEAIVKVIIETCLLTDDEKKAVCAMLLKTGARFVKTSTGFSTGGATVPDIALMKAAVGDNMLVKASGGVKTNADMMAMLEAGADRIGTSSGVALISQM